MNTQILRTERLLKTLPANQKAAFVTLLMEAREQRQQIQRELDEVCRILPHFDSEPT